MAFIKLSAIERRRLSAFFSCLALASVAWIVTILSNSRPYITKVVLDFRNTPQKRAFHSLQSDTVNATINGTGWDLLFSRMIPSVPSLPVDLHTLENRSYVVLSSQIDQINNKRLGSQPVINFSPDTLYFDFSNRKVKRIPINLVSAIKYRHQFFQSGPVTLNPGYVIINGPAAVIDKISYWNSDTLRTDSVDEPVKTQLTLRPVDEGNLSIYPRSIQVNVPVEEFTEKQIEIPVRLVNNINYQDVKIFPQKVKVTFTVAMSKYEQTDDDFFEADADLDLWRLHNYKVLPVKVTKLPDYCKLVRIEPRTIDFIVKK